METPFTRIHGLPLTFYEFQEIGHLERGSQSPCFLGRTGYLREFPYVPGNHVKWPATIKRHRQFDSWGEISKKNQIFAFVIIPAYPKCHVC